MSYFVYILLSKKDDRLYVGCTEDPNQRLKDHNYGKVLATRNRRPLFMIHTEEIVDKANAFNRERFLKSLWGAREKKRILNKYINKIGHIL
ncbi:MAG: GIY-YIG nuclease family protein [Minisyncoccia bacterium]